MKPDAEKLKRPRPAWLKPFARFGYGARGLVYLVVGFFTLVTAVSGGDNRDTRDAIEFLSRNALGDSLTVALIAGLACYSLWRFVQAILDADDHGLDVSGAAVRAGLLVSGGTYAVLSLYAFSLWWGSGGFGSGDGGGGDGGNGGFADLLAQAVGSRYAAILLATIFAGVAAAHFWKALRRKYRAHIDAPSTAMRLVDPVAIAGLTARGAIFLFMAVLFYTRGVTAGEDGGEPGLKEALDYIVSLPAGHWLLGATGVGLVAFAAYSFAEARWRRIDVSSG